MKNPILALLAILAVITSGLLYAAPTLRDRIRGNDQVQIEVPQVPQAQVPQIEPPVVEEPTIESPITPPPIAKPRNRLLPLRKPQQIQIQPQAEYLPQSSELVLPTSYGYSMTVVRGPNIFHPFSCITRTVTKYPVTRFVACPYYCEYKCLGCKFGNPDMSF